MGISPGEYYISVDHLDVGMYVLLDLGWMEHDFPLNSFKIKNQRQIDQIKAHGLKKIRIDPARSVFVPPAYVEEEPESAEEIEEATGESPEDALERAQREFMLRQYTALAECEKQFAKAAGSLRAINANVHARPQEAFNAAAGLVHDLLDTITGHKDVAIRLMNDKAGSEEMYYHALNVSVLAMMLARELNIPPADNEQLGIGCLFHDIGKTLIPYRVLKADKPSRAEVNLQRQHCEYGATIGAKVDLSSQALAVVVQHHEHVDGSGYPDGLKGEDISPLARIACIVNAYDNHCNPQNPADALTPYEALAHMYAHERKWYDVAYLTVFIRAMGVYPPGAVVKLEDGRIGIVIAANFGTPLRPRVLIYDPSVSKNNAPILDLQQHPELNIKSSIRPSELTAHAYEYLAPRTRVTYFFDTATNPSYPS
ncbi:MAG: DUF3391 domain-containing protein [Burkholderiaceae bacterium]|nr:DUF3391 domain-containing protein [Burkholderiaceae bacterium]